MKLSLGHQVLIAVVLGMIAGVFFGPLTAALQPVGDAYTMLLQMAALPYICFSLIHGIGSMDPATGKRLFKCGWPYLLTLWALMFVILFFLVQLIPDSVIPLIKTNGKFEFESNFSKNFLTYIIPQNPFYDVANNIVPAVAIFGLIGGLALMHIEKKEPLIGMLERVNQTIEKLLYWLGLLSPIAAFVYISIAFGTIHFEDLPKIEGYVIAFILTTFFVTFWILPTLLSSLTPITFKEATKAIKFICLLPLVTGLSTMALPFLNIYLKNLSSKHEVHTQFRRTSQTVLPIAYSFGNIGNAMCLFLTFFLAFYFRHPLQGAEKILVSILTVPLSIGSATSNVNSMLFLIQQLGFPQAAIDLFLELKAMTYNFQVMMSVASVLTLIILVLYSYYGLLHIKWKPLFTRLGFSLILIAGIVFSSKFFIHFNDNYQNLYMSLKISDLISNPVAAEILPTPEQRISRDPGELLNQILNTRVLKVGFNDQSIPYAYYNGDKELVGYDIAYAYQLARDLDCKLEFVPFLFVDLISNIENGIFDIGMSSIIMSEDRIVQMNFTFPYAQDNNVLIVPVGKTNQFLNLKKVMEMDGLKLGVGGIHVPLAKHHFPKAKVINNEAISKDFMAPLMKGEVDAVIWSESSAFVWCLAHPAYAAIDYGSLLGVSYFGYPIKQNETSLIFFLNNWLSLKEQSGFKSQMHSYWIDGVPPKKTAPRWSIINNVLHWTNNS